MSTPTRVATPASLLLKIPNGPPHPDHLATMLTDVRGSRGGTVAVAFNPEEAAQLGRRLLDWAGRADPVTAVEAVGHVMRGDGR